MRETYHSVPTASNLCAHYLMSIFVWQWMTLAHISCPCQQCSRLSVHWGTRWPRAEIFAWAQWPPAFRAVKAPLLIFSPLTFYILELALSTKCTIVEDGTGSFPSSIVHFHCLRASKAYYTTLRVLHWCHCEHCQLSVILFTPSVAAGHVSTASSCSPLTVCLKPS